jgi:tRNA pseudouridine55 synthase
MADPFGILNVNKPAGWTSRDVVNRVHRLVRPAKAGHAGTLDPLATGVLVVCVGAATRLIEYVHQQPKQYEAAFLLGRSSDTEDIEGNVIELDQPALPTREQIESALPRFLGEIEQRPPAFSAVKVRGQRAYKLARAGEQVELAPRKVRIDELEILGFQSPCLRLRVVCGSGTYIRSLGRDLAAALGTSAVMCGLCRTAVGQFDLGSAAQVEDLEAAGAEPFLLPAAMAVHQLPSLVLNDAEIDALKHGRSIPGNVAGPRQEVAAFDPAGRLAAILAPDARSGLKPHRNFAQSL